MFSGLRSTAFLLLAGRFVGTADPVPAARVCQIVPARSTIPRALAVPGCGLLSGLSGYRPLDPCDTLCCGEPPLHPQRMPRAAVEATAVPMMVACAEGDPPRLQAEFLDPLRAWLAKYGVLPRAPLASGHNHYPMVLYPGMSGPRLADQSSVFVEQCRG